MFYLTTHSTHFIYGYMASDIWLRTILIVRKETRCRHIGYFYRLTARAFLYAPSHRQENTYHGLCYTSRGALAGARNSSMGPPHEGSIRRPTAPWANALTMELHLAPAVRATLVQTGLYGLIQNGFASRQFVRNVLPFSTSNVHLCGGGGGGGMGGKQHPLPQKTNKNPHQKPPKKPTSTEILRLDASFCKLRRNHEWSRTPTDECLELKALQ